MPGCFSGIYTTPALTSYFKGLQNVMERQDPARLRPVAIAILSIDHAIAVGYSPRHRAWYFVDANKLMTQPLPSAWKLAEETIATMSSNHITAMITRFYGTRQHARLFSYLFHAWRKTPEWQSVHTISPHKLNLVDSLKISWLHIAIESGQYGTVRALLREGAKARVRSDYSYPLYCAVELGESWSVRLLKQHGANAQTIIRKPMEGFRQYISQYNGFVRRRARLFIARQTAAGLVTTHLPISPYQLGCILGNRYILNLLTGPEGIMPDRNPALFERLHQFIRGVAPGVYRKAGDYRRAALYQAAHDLLFLYQCFARLEEKDIPVAAKVGELNVIARAILAENTDERIAKLVF